MIARWIAAAGLACAAAGASAQDFAFDLPAGLACPGFDLRVEVWANPRQVFREFFDRNGNPVRLLVAGKGNTLRLTNLASGAALSLRPNGATSRTALLADGSQRVESLGHQVLILFPSDVPAGPTTTLIVGRLVYTVDASGVFVVSSTNGTSNDLCAALG